MMTKEELLRISRTTGMKPHQQEKHYIQTLTLQSIYSRFDPVFKGGTSLLFLEGLNRFSEDLDFTAQSDAYAGDMMSAVLGDFEYRGMRARARMVNDTRTGFSFKVSAEGPLFTREIEKCHVKVEISVREKVILAPRNRFVHTPYPDILPFGLLAMHPKELMAEKVRATITREKARDVYDLWFLMEKGWRTETDIVERKLSYYGEKFDISVFEEALERKRALWKSELIPIIFGELPDFDGVKNDLLENMNRWMCGL